VLLFLPNAYSPGGLNITGINVENLCSALSDEMDEKPSFFGSDFKYVIIFDTIKLYIYLNSG